MSELIDQYAQSKLGIEDLKLLRDLVKSDRAQAAALAQAVGAVWESAGRGTPVWPETTSNPRLGRKYMVRLYLLAGIAAAFLIFCIVIGLMLYGTKAVPKWSAQVSKVAPAAHYEAPKKAEKVAPVKPEDPERIQLGPVIEISQPVSGHVVIDVKTIDGEEVRKGLFSGQLDAGMWKFPWDGLDKRSQLVLPGIYRVEVQRDNGRKSSFKMRLTQAHIKALKH